MATKRKQIRKKAWVPRVAARRAADRGGLDLRRLADSVPQMAWIARADGTVDYFNRRWEECTGLDGSQPAEDGWLAAVHFEDGPRCSKAWQQAVSSGQPFQMECRIKHAGSSDYQWHLIFALAVRHENGRVMNWFGICAGVDGRKNDLDAEVERRVSERTAHLQAAGKELEALSYSISHDLRAPLRSINAFSQLLLEDYQDKLDEQGREFVRIVIESSNHMARLIEGLLQLSRINRGELRLQAVDLSALTTQIVDGLSQLEPQREVDVIVAPDLQAKGDERLLRTALEHLLKNAWKFSSRQSRARIEFGAETSADGRVFFVRDNGAGFDAAYAAKLFGAFQRLHSASEFPGQGIGLALVQRIISRHGGRVWADAVVDCGATFYFTLPPIVSA